MLTSVIYTLYTIIAVIFSVIILKRLDNLKQQWDNDAMAVLCRLGILVMTIGTTLDNARAVFGNLYQSVDQTDTTLNFIVSWYCVINHQWLTAFCVFTPFCFIQKLVTTDRWKRLVPRIAVGFFVILFVFAGFNYLKAQPNPMYVKTECTEVDRTFKLSVPKGSVNFSLVSVFAYQFLMVGAGIVMIYKYGCQGDSQWHLIFLIANFLCLPGQALQQALGPYYECYASNFWEQLTFGSAVFADMVLNTTSSGLESSSYSKSEERQLSYVQMDEDNGKV